MDVKEAVRKYNWVPLVLVLVFGFILINPLFFKHKIVHQSPQGFLASDAYWDASYAASALKTGYYNQEPGFMTGHAPAKITPGEPPLIVYANAIMASLFKIPYYDASTWLLFLVLTGGLLALYLLSAKVDALLPYFTLPVTLLLFTFPFNSAISWGFWKLYLAAMFLLPALVIFLLSDRSWKLMILLGAMFAAIIMTHPTVMLAFGFLMIVAYLNEIISDKTKRTLRTFSQYALIPVLGILISIDFGLNMYAGRVHGRSAIQDIISPGYNLGSATTSTSHLGIFWWLSLLGLLLLVFSLNKNKERSQKTIAVMMIAAFLVFLGPMIGYDRIFQLRLVWPLFIAPLVGVFILAAFQLLNLKDRERHIAAAVLCAAIFLFIFIPQANKTDLKSQATISLTEDEYWEALMTLSALPQSRIFAIDPTLTQHSVLLNSLQYTRFLMHNDAAYNRNITDFSQSHCVDPSLLRTGFISFIPNTVSKKYCADGPVDLCTIDYFLIHAQVATEQQKEWFLRQMNMLQQKNLTVVWQKGNVMIAKNNEVCTS